MDENIKNKQDIDEPIDNMFVILIVILIVPAVLTGINQIISFIVLR